MKHIDDWTDVNDDGTYNSENPEERERVFIVSIVWGCIVGLISTMLLIVGILVVYFNGY